MKAKYHFPTEEFGFVEVDGEVETIGEAMANYHSYGEDMSKLEPKEWRHVLDIYIEGNPMASEVYERMSAREKDIIQEIKKSHKRRNK